MNTTTLQFVTQSQARPRQLLARPEARGKFLFGPTGEKLYFKGVTYGTFRPDALGCDYPARQVVAADFRGMAEAGINAVRTYTMPPEWLLDAAAEHGLAVMPGLPWEQHIAFLHGKARQQEIERKVRELVRRTAGHPAIFAYAVGNEIPAPIVRWHGRRPVEQFIERLYTAVKEEDPGSLVTYVSYPSTEYLQLPFLDFAAFNVYLESEQTLATYLARLQNIAGDRPLVIAEIGLDSRRQGLDRQAWVLDWQIHATFSAGAAGMFVYAWTDEWYRGGHDIDDWDFGLTTRDRRPKPALATVRDSFAEVPFPDGLSLPRISVVVCVYNGEDYIGETLEALTHVVYPDFEVIVVDDGSTDRTAAIAARYPCRLVSTPNRGLSAARNVGMYQATGEIVAYLDGDAYPDPHWLQYLASTFATTRHVGVGGPNLHPPEDPDTAECVSNAPGGPNHVLLSDTEAEHIPGCNMAFRKSALLAIGGFDPQFRAAGDDVDLCWRLQEKGWTIGFSPSALVWHHRRDSVRAYWKQQKGYGKAEALLERKWPGKYNRLGHIEWKGRLYGLGRAIALFTPRWRVYHGMWGSGLFQSIYATQPKAMTYLPLMPEWLLLIAGFGFLSALALFWPPLKAAMFVLSLLATIMIAQAGVSAVDARISPRGRSRTRIVAMRLLIFMLHLVQPVARLTGRLQYGLHPWRKGKLARATWPRVMRVAYWSERWRAPEAVLRLLESYLRLKQVVVLRGGDFDRWDLEVATGSVGSVRLLMAIEEHGAGKQLIRFRLWPRLSTSQVVVTAAGILLAAIALATGAWQAAALIALPPLGFLTLAFLDCARATSLLLAVLDRLGIGIRVPSRRDRAQAGKAAKRDDGAAAQFEMGA